MSIIITNSSQGFNVIKDDKRAIGLCWEEMLGLVASLTFPENKPCIQWLRTEQENESLKEYIESLSDCNISQKGEQC